MRPSRSERLSALIREIISEIIFKMKDPRVKFVTVTDVAMSKDMRYAKIFISILGDEEEKKTTFLAIKNATGFIRTELAHKLEIRRIPEISFVLDDSIERGVKLANYIEKVTNEG
ncbi:MAG: 30S ribosome-binding factor RbfA [bacterium]